MTIKEEQTFFSDSFICERLSSNEMNADLITGFTVDQYGEGLLTYLQQKAWKHDDEGETAVYFVKDKESNRPVLYFSLRCGLLYDFGKYQELSDEEREFVQLLVEARQQKDIDSETNLLASIESMYGVTRKNTIIDIALKKAEHELSKKGQETEMKVRNTYSAIELCHFCRNTAFKPTVALQTRIGFGIFWEHVIPKIEEIVGVIGSRYLYLFASDEELSTKSEEYRLINYYNTLGFQPLFDFNILKPDYDSGCYPMMQSIENVIRLRSSIWESYEENDCD